jgi:superfamily II RNA helicase
VSGPTFLVPPQRGSDDALLDGFLEWVSESGVELYPAQEEAILELFADRHVVLTTPTGSGKSLVATAQHYAALGRAERSFYTAPIKALVSEKFFELRGVFGPDVVGMVTGDAAINANAPIICCTAEILANMALRDGPHTAVDRVAVDEFHFYADPSRGWAWQVPLLTLPHVRFLLMTATMGEPDFFVDELQRRTDRPAVVVHSDQRPVPLDFAYRDTPLHESIAELLTTDLAPVYIVHFTQRAAAEQAQNLMSLDVLTKEEKAHVREVVGGFRFDTPIGKDLRRYVGHGVGIHHAGLLPKYRLLVERLAGEGLLKLICGTDTLGVGVNVPIRTVLFTQLCKYDGATTRVLSVREFKQIAGRAGRKGFDDHGYVWAQAPPHVVENRRADEKAASGTGKRKKVVKKKPPERGYAHWDEQTFDRLRDREPETLRSSFSVSHAMLLQMLQRPGDGCAATRRLMVDNHETRKAQRTHIRRAVAIYRSLLEADIVETLDEPDDEGRLVRITVDLQDDFSLNQPLSPFVVEYLEVFDPDAPDYALDVLTLVESVLEDPRVVLMAQLDRLKDHLVAAMKAEGVEYEERMERLAEATWPQPNAEELWAAYRVFAQQHPWVGEDRVRPKSIARDMYETGRTFRDYVTAYGLKRSEGVLLRYLSDVYKTMQQTVPESARTDEVDELIGWLGAVVRQVDSSLIDEWERLTAGDPDALDRPRDDAPTDITTDVRGFRALVRSELFRWVQLLARGAVDELAQLEPAAEPWSADDLAHAMEPYWDEHDWIGIDAEARSARHLSFEESGADRRPATQWLLDPADSNEWRIEAEVDMERSREEGHAVVLFRSITRVVA